MQWNNNELPRRILWAAAIIAALALLTIIVVQVMTVVMTTRPPTLSRWLTGLYFIASQAIVASIGLGIAAHGLQSANRSSEPTLRPIAATSTSAPVFVRAAPIIAATTTAAPSEPSLPRELRSAVAAVSSEPKKRRGGK